MTAIVPHQKAPVLLWVNYPRMGAHLTPRDCRRLAAWLVRQAERIDATDLRADQRKTKRTLKRMRPFAKEPTSGK